MSKVLVIGGAGFIGKALTRHLQKSGHDVLVADSFIERVHGISMPSLESHQVKIDSRFPKDFFNIIGKNRFDEIYFLASDTSTGSSLQEIDSHVNQNTTALAGLLKYLSDVNIMPSRIVLTSSRAIYGEGHEIEENGTINTLRPRSRHELEGQKWQANRDPHKKYAPNHFRNPPNPSNVYGLTKLFQENLLRMWTQANDVRANIYRLQNVIGPGQNPRNAYSGVITAFCKEASNGLPLKIFEGGEIVRDFVHVDDVASALLIPLNPNFDTVDIGRYVPVKLLDIANEISAQCKAPDPIITNQFRVGDVATAYADPDSKLALSHSWNPRNIDSEIIGEIIEYVRGEEANNEKKFNQN